MNYELQERTSNTVWRTESTYDTREEAVRALESLVRREPNNEDGEPVEYRIVES